MIALSSPAIAHARELCQAALDRYRELAHRAAFADADAGFDEAYESGRRTLESRCEAADWVVSPERVVSVRLLLDDASFATDVEAAELLSTFPVRFWNIIERRADVRGEPTRLRRALDRLSAS